MKTLSNNITALLLILILTAQSFSASAMICMTIEQTFTPLSTNSGCKNHIAEDENPNKTLTPSTKADCCEKGTCSMLGCLAISLFESTVFSPSLHVTSPPTFFRYTYISPDLNAVLRPPIVS